MSDAKPPQCGVDGCTEQSDYLLTVGDRCEKHAREEQSETVDYINWAL